VFLLEGAREWIVRCAADRGETCDAIKYAAKYRLYGIRNALVPDMLMANGPERLKSQV
jgi:hypothetical protein